MTAYLLISVLLFVPIPGNAGCQSREGGVEDAIREAVLRYMFAHEAQQQAPYTKVLFVAFGEGDPDDKFVTRFQTHTPPVKKVSESELTNDIRGVIDKKTREGGVRYSVRELKWVTEDEVDVAGSYYVAALFAGGCDYRVVREGDNWVVKGCSGHRRVS